MTTKNKPAQAISNRIPQNVTVEFDTVEGRATKTLNDAVAAKKFFIAKDRAGKAPKIIGDKSGDASAPSAEQPAEPPAKAPHAPGALHADNTTGDAAEATEKMAEAKPSKRRAPKPATERTQKMTVPAAAAIVLHAVGLDANITDEMVAKVGELVGRQNAYQDVFVLRQSRLAIRAYLAAAKQ